MYLKSVMEGSSVHGNCGAEELNILFCVLFVYNLIINNIFVCHQQIYMIWTQMLQNSVISEQYTDIKIYLTFIILGSM